MCFCRTTRFVVTNQEVDFSKSQFTPDDSNVKSHTVTFCPIFSSFFSEMISQAQKNAEEEDSSGSDSDPELSSEPETDRFGFILTNGSTAG